MVGGQPLLLWAAVLLSRGAKSAEESCSAGLGEGAAAGLGDIVADVGFRAENYERWHRYMPRVLGTAAVARLQGLDERVFALVNKKNQGSFQKVVDNVRVPVGAAPTTNDVRAAAAVGTVIVNRMQDADAFVAELADGVRTQLGIRPNINLYAAPPSTTGLLAHHDPQDVFIVQTVGSKHWTVCAPLGAGKLLPTRVSEQPGHPAYSKYAPAQLANANCTSHTLRVGDVLYMPRGTIHHPHTTAADSVHLTVGFDGDFTWMNFLQALFKTKAITNPAAFVTCLQERDLNKLVAHEVLMKLKGREQLAAVSEAFLASFAAVDWSACPAEVTKLLTCPTCTEDAVWFMHELQVRARQGDLDHVWR